MVCETACFVFGRRFEMRDQALALTEEGSSTKSNLEIDLDEVIQSLEEAAQEIEKVDWEHGELAGNDR
jgi:hypothetical protein